MSENTGALKYLKNKSTMVVAVMGPKGSGKTTACEHLAKIHGGKVVSFASELKRISKLAFELTDDDLSANKEASFVVPKELKEKQLKKIVVAMKDKLNLVKPDNKWDTRRIAANDYPYTKFTTSRQIFQHVGTDIMHKLYPSFHCDVVRFEICNPGLFFIDDLRFVSEYQFLKEVYPNLSIVEIKGRNEVKKGKEEHVSEAEWKEIPEEFTLDNSKTISLFRDSVIKLFEEICTSKHKYLTENTGLEAVVKAVNDDMVKTSTGVGKDGKIQIGNAVFTNTQFT